MRSKLEAKDLSKVIEAGKKYGFGNCIQALQCAWAKKLMQEKKMTNEACLLMGRVEGTWESSPKKKISKTEVDELVAFCDQILEGIYENE